MLTPSWRDTQTLDEFFIKGRNMWPDLKDLQQLRLNRALVDDRILQFIRSTALNEHGIVHYVRSYLTSYEEDYKLGIWAAMWGGEEYLHSVVLRLILRGLGEEISEREEQGLETGSYIANQDAYLERVRLKPHMSRRLLTLIYGVIQEFAAVIAYGAVADACREPTVAQLLRRVAKDEMRHCRFFQLSLEELAANSPPEVRELVWPQFSALFKDFRMPQEQIELFAELGGTELYTSFWTPEHRSRLILFLTHYFARFRSQPMGQAAPAAGAVPAA